MVKKAAELTNPFTELSIRKAAVLSSAAILLMTAAAVIAAEITIRSFIVPNNAAAATNNIITIVELIFIIPMLSETAFRFWLLIIGVKAQQ